MVDRVQRGRDRDRETSSKGGTGKTYKGYKRPDGKERTERANRKSAGFDTIFKNNVNRFQYEKGKNPLRICPPTFEPNPGGHYFMQVWVHPRQGSDFSDYLCLAKMKNKPCAFCDGMKAAQEDGEDAEDVKRFKPRDQYVGWVLARESDDPDTPQAYKMSFTQDRNLAALCQTKKGSILYVEDPDNGYDINVRRTGSGLNTEYLPSIDHESTPLLESPKKQKAVLDWIAANPIDTALEYKTYAYMEQVIKGVIDEKDDDLDDDDEPKKKKSKRRDEEEDEEDESDNEEKEARADKKRRSKREEPEEEEEEEEETDEEETEEDEPEEEEEEPEPRGRRSKAKRTREEPEEEEEETEEEETEDEPEEEEETEDEPEEEEEEEENPKRRPTAGASRHGKTKPKPRREEPEEEEDEGDRKRPARTAGKRRR